ncbi:hypothetical protein MUU49_01380 [Scandinavium goeteborgense]|uniref:hypothetical protein n=1 Tax=Scandinavium goeteborgense TaxID=1851514 RepID=UPI0021654CAE|nr:hypothetical protein [Scandinavium goeteborgense]MCS2151244.1 hypothetical protein [Scandinavium goeteborgense]
MYDKYSKSFSEKFNTLIDPVNNFKDTCVDNVSKSINLHKSTADACCDISMSQLENAKRVKDFNSLMQFNEKTIANIASLSNKQLENFMAMKEMMNAFSFDMSSQIKESSTVVSKKNP